jgi:hypothetical protein
MMLSPKISIFNSISQNYSFFNRFLKKGREFWEKKIKAEPCGSLKVKLRQAAVKLYLAA